MPYSQKSNERILLVNLINIRWVAIAGQLSAIIIVNFFLNISIPLLYCLSVIIVSIIINFLSLFPKTRSNYLSENEAFYFLLYDTIQLAILLYLTGGIYNPFCLLLIAPVIISSSYLKIGYSIILSLFSLIIVVFLSLFYIEIIWPENFLVPKLFTNGLVLALIISIIFIAIYVYILANSSRKISNALSQTQIALINQKKVSALGSLAAAAVHELSTPLNTIFLILGDLKRDKTLNDDLKSEILLLETQANRCKEILLNLSKDPQNVKDTFLQRTTISNLINLNFEKFLNKKNNLNLKIETLTKEDEPLINFSDEMMYGLGNIIQNAVKYANNRIDVNISWNKQNIFISITDDGKGFTNDVLEKMGNPYIFDKKNGNNMGLGIFIAKNLIENIGGNMKFYNKTKDTGSIVEIQLKRNT
jgi:two-component system sensor histidine kinase RegB